MSTCMCKGTSLLGDQKIVFPGTVMGNVILGLKTKCILKYGAQGRTKACVHGYRVCSHKG